MVTAEKTEHGYCMHCGAESVLEPIRNMFNPTTGKPMNRKVCSKKPCEHNGCNDDAKDPNPPGFFKSFFMQCSGFSCSRCDKPYVRTD